MEPTSDDQGYLPEVYQRFKAEHPEVMEAYAALAEACRSAGTLPAREQRLVKLGIAVGLASDGAVRSHVRRGLREGMSRADLTHAILLAVPTAGFPTTIAAYQWAAQVFDSPDDGELRR